MTKDWKKQDKWALASRHEKDADKRDGDSSYVIIHKLDEAIKPYSKWRITRNRDEDNTYEIKLSENPNSPNPFYHCSLYLGGGEDLLLDKRDYKSWRVQVHKNTSTAPSSYRWGFKTTT